MRNDEVNLFFCNAIRGAIGDVVVGVGSVLGLGARARVKFFIFYFSCIGYAPYHSKKRKKQFGQNRVRARTPSPAPAFVFFSKDLSLWVL